MMEITWLPFNLAGKIYRSAMPFSAYDPDGTLLQGYLHRDIDQVVMLVEDHEARLKTGRDLRRAYEEAGLSVLYLPIIDFSVPERETCSRVVDQVLESMSAGVNTVVHCHAGLGRTGLFAACLAKQILSASGEEALTWIRRYIPGAVETRAQQDFVNDF